MEDYIIDLLKTKVIPAVGCTEPIAVALATAKAREFDEITEDGTLVYRVMEGGDQELAEKTHQSGIIEI